MVPVAIQEIESIADTLQLMMHETQILRDNDPRCLELESSGYKLVGESWGARLRLNSDDDLSIYSNAVNIALENGIELQELDISFANALLDLELVNNPDYPYTPATFHDVPTIETICALWCPENLVFGAFFEGVLVGAISTSDSGEIVELDFASILRVHRGKGIGKALASAAILEWNGRGIRVFGTGGAMANDASLRTVKSL